MDALGSSDMFLFDDFRLDWRGLFRRDQAGVFVPVKIGSRALDILRMLVERPGELVSKDELVAAVWSGTVVEEGNLTVQISTVRGILDKPEAGVACIQTVAGRGYRFVAAVAHEIAAASSTGSAPLANTADSINPKLPAPDRSGEGRAWWRRRFGLLGLIGLVVIASVALLGWDHRWFSEGRIPRLSIVVLPFTNLSSDPDQEYFADAVTGDLTTDLSRINDSFVIAHTTAATYKGEPVDVKQIGRDLGVRYVLAGSVRRLANGLQVNVQLLDGESGAHVWADRFDFQPRDLAEAQSEITARLARMLNIELIKDTGRRIEQEHAANPDARDLVMRAKAMYFQVGSLPSNNRQSIRRAAIGLLEQALNLDPGSVDAKLQTAAVLVDGVVEGASNSVEQDEARAEKLIREAMERDPNRSQAYLWMGKLRRIQGRWAESQAELETAVALDPNDPGAIRQMGETVLAEGKPEAAISYFEKTLRLDPRGPYIYVAYFMFARCHLYLGHTDEAVDLYRKARALNPGMWYVHIGLAGALGLRGDIEEAKSEIAEAVKLKPDANSFTGLRAIGGQGCCTPQYEEMREKTSSAGLRRAGFPEE